MISANLRHCFETYNDDALNKLSSQYYKILADYLWNGLIPKSKAQLEHYIHFENAEILNQGTSSNTIILASHLGNWELITPFLSSKLSMESYGVYMPIKNKTIDSFVKRKRGKYGLNLIAMERVIRILNEPYPKVITLISDQSPPLGFKATEIKLFGKPTRWYNSIDKINSKYDCQVFYQVVRPSKTKILVEYIPLTGVDILSQYVTLLENDINSYPAYWLWSHKRWKGMGIY